MVCATLWQQGLSKAHSASACRRTPDRKPAARSKANLASIAPAVTVPAADQQICHFMRHGQTVMNVFLSQTPYGSPEFQDPLMCVSTSATLQLVLAGRVF